MNKKAIEPIKNPDKIKNYWLEDKNTVILLSIFGILYNVGMIARPIYQGKLIDALVNKISFYDLINLAIMSVIIIGLVQVFRYLKRYYVRRFANKTTATMRFMLYNSIIHKSDYELIDENMGSMMTKVISDVDVCVEGMRKVTTETFDTGVLFVTYLVTLFTYDVKTTLCACIFIPVSIFIAKKLKKVIFKFTRDYRQKISDVSEMTYQMIDNAVLYRLYGREADNKKVYQEELKEFEKISVLSNIWANSLQPMYNIVTMMGIVFVIMMLGNKVIDKTITVGAFSAYISIFSIMASKASRIAKLFNTVQKSKVSWQRIKPYLEEYQSTDKNENKIKSDDINLKIENLYFKYENHKDYIIKNLNLTATKGDIIGITGPIGCGKTTFSKIFLGNNDYEGSIKINNYQLRDYTKFERSNLISYLGHNPCLMSDTIYNNISLGDNKSIDYELKMVCFEEDLENMKEKTDTLVGNGGIRLSGGQQSRIALARTLHYKNKIIILDDPFSAVDMKTEKEIINNLEKNYGDCLIILISHRLSIFKDLDKIILINKNGEIDYGSHQELLDNSLLYNQLFSLQKRKVEA